MITYPSFDQVCDDLGDKVIDGFSRAVARTAEDLHEYRTAHPDWVAESSERGLANWLHDRLWIQMVRALRAIEDAGDLVVVDREPLRELVVGTRYKLRAKRHSPDGEVASYPTQTALEFFLQQPALDGLEEIRLLVGYEWDRETRAVVQPVLSLRTAKEKVVWQEALPEPHDARRTSATAAEEAIEHTGPAAPRIELPSSHERDGGQETGA